MLTTELISELIEPYTPAWKSLPEAVRKLMVERAEAFTLVPRIVDADTGVSYPPDIKYHGVVIAYNTYSSCWYLKGIEDYSLSPSGTRK